jgi:hypothetical protein
MRRLGSGALTILLLLMLSLSMVPIQSQAKSFTVWSAYAEVGSPYTQIAPLSPYLPSGGTAAGSGTFALNEVAPGRFAYAYGNGGYLGEYPFGSAIQVVPFPDSMAALNNAYLPCGYPYASTYSVATGTLGVTRHTDVAVWIYTDDAMEVFYKRATAVTWSSVFGGAAWQLQGGTYYSGIMQLNAGTYDVRVVWVNACGPGVQAILLSY